MILSTAGVRTRAASSQSCASVIESGTRWHPAGNTPAMPTGSLAPLPRAMPFTSSTWQPVTGCDYFVR